MYSCLEHRLKWWHREGRKSVASGECSGLTRTSEKVDALTWAEASGSFPGVFPPPLLLCFEYHSLLAMLTWVTQIDLVICVCHLPDFRGPRRRSGFVLSFHLLGFFLPVLHGSLTMRYGRKGGGRAGRLCVSIFIGFFFFPSLLFTLKS